MGMTGRDIWTIIHGMGFGMVLFLLFPVVLGVYWMLGRSGDVLPDREKYLRLLLVGLVVMTILAWLTDISGTFFSYAWFRAQPSGSADLAKFPQAYLLAHPQLAAWEDYGMEWKEHLAWFVPILLTAAVYLIFSYRDRVFSEKILFRAVFLVLAGSFLATALAALLGALVSRIAPVR